MSVNAGCVNYRPAPTPLSETSAGSPPPELWTSRAGRAFAGVLERRDTILYGGGWDRKVYAVGLDSGRVLWSRSLGAPVLGGVRLGDTVLYAGTSRPSGKVHAVRIADGKQLWSNGVGEVDVPIALADGGAPGRAATVIAHTSRGYVAALDARTGEQRWRRRLGVGWAGPVVLGDGRVVATTADSVFLLAADDGRILRRRPTAGAVVGQWIRLGAGPGELLVAGTTDSLVVAIATTDLAPAWQVRVDAPVFGTPAARGDSLYVVTRIGSVYRVVLTDPAMTGSSPATAGPAAAPPVEQLAALRWPVTAPPVFARDLLLLGGADGTLRGLRLDGTEVWRLAIWRPIEVPPVPLDDGFVAVGGNGDLHRYRQ